VLFVDQGIGTVSETVLETVCE